MCNVNNWRVVIVQLDARVVADILNGKGDGGVEGWSLVREIRKLLHRFISIF